MGNFFRSVLGAAKAKLQAKVVTAGTSAINVNPDSGYDGLSQVAVNPTPSQEKTVTASRSAQTVTPDTGKLLSKVTVNKYPDASGTYGTITSNGTHDMGATNNYRYAGVNVANSFASAFSNVAASVHEKGSGQTITETYKASSAGEYLVIAWGYAYDDTSTVSISISSTGTLLGYQNTKTTGDYRTFTCNVRIFRLAVNQTITVSLGSAQHGRGRVILKIK